MKKLVLGLMCLVLTIGSFSGCSKKEAAKDSREVVLDELGLTYTTPDAWREYEETNIVPLSFNDENTLAEIIYVYVPDEGMKQINEGSKTVAQVGHAICELVVAKTESFTNGTQKKLTDFYKSNEKVSEQGEYSYYLLSDFKTTAEKLTGEDLADYNKLVGAVPDLKSSITTKKFDPSIIEERIEQINKYITFDTQSLEGAPVDSTVFGNYDITIVNFGATYTYPEFNEFAKLQELYTIVKNINGTDINLISITIDTPSERAEKAAKEEKKKADASFLTLKMDDLLSTWATKNLEGVPSTVFVDRDGKIIGEIVKGAKDLDVYLAELEKRVEEINARDKK